MEKTMLNDETLVAVAGGAMVKTKEPTFEDRKKEFETAWKNLKMDNQGISGMRMAQLFDEWEMSEYELDAATFLSKA